MLYATFCSSNLFPHHSFYKIVFHINISLYSLNSGYQLKLL